MLHSTRLEGRGCNCGVASAGLLSLGASFGQDMLSKHLRQPPRLSCKQLFGLIGGSLAIGSICILVLCVHEPSDKSELPVQLVLFRLCMCSLAVGAGFLVSGWMCSRWRPGSTTEANQPARQTGATPCGLAPVGHSIHDLDRVSAMAAPGAHLFRQAAQKER